MRRWLVGPLLMLHALAHALPGMRASEWAMRRGSSGDDPGRLVATAALLFVTASWAVAMGGLLAAGAGLMGVEPWRRGWRQALIAGLAGSIVVLVAGRGPDVVSGLLLDAAAAIALWRYWKRGDWERDRIVRRSTAGEGVQPRPGTGWGRRVATALVGALLVYSVGVVVARPWVAGWGARPSEWTRPLPGDEFLEPDRFLIQHAISIGAPPADVWPWLVQIGHDRGGFYSYAWLENLFGLRVRNATRIVPEWQDLEAGDFVSSVPADWMGGRLRDWAGWRVLRVDRARVMVLKNWGAFVLEPDGPDRTRLIVRMGIRARGAIALRWGDLLIWEPAHFIMERKMLLTLRDRAQSTEAGLSGG